LIEEPILRIEEISAGIKIDWRRTGDVAMGIFMMLLDVVICDPYKDQRIATCQTRVTLRIFMMLLDVVICDHDRDQQAARRQDEGYIGDMHDAA
jgi:hypothetical protein